MRFASRIAASLLAAALPLVGCATLGREEALERERMLMTAGFRLRRADTDARLAYVKAMPPFKLVSHVEDGRVSYSFADPEYCQCLFVGGPKEYSAYQQLSLENASGDEPVQLRDYGPSRADVPR